MESFYQRFYKKKFCCIQLVSAFVISTLLTLTIGSPGYASSDAYDSGYDHGCDDAGISDPDDRYYNQPEKGPSFHTDAFNRGYNDGFDTCSGSDNDNQPRSDSAPEPSNTDSGYRITVSIGDHPFGNQYSYIGIETEDGWNDNARLATAGDPSVTFHVPPGYGDTVKICASSAIIAPSTCVTRNAGEDINERLDVRGLLD
ncbi:MAG: hypothetical protein WA941_18415 [Nitrososphaeraceae archaeon]